MMRVLIVFVTSWVMAIAITHIESGIKALKAASCKTGRPLSQGPIKH